MSKRRVRPVHMLPTANVSSAEETQTGDLGEAVSEELEEYLDKDGNTHVRPRRRVVDPGLTNTVLVRIAAGAGAHLADGTTLNGPGSVRVSIEIAEQLRYREGFSIEDADDDYDFSYYGDYDDDNNWIGGIDLADGPDTTALAVFNGPANNVAAGRVIPIVDGTITYDQIAQGTIEADHLTMTDFSRYISDTISRIFGGSRPIPALSRPIQASGVTTRDQAARVSIQRFRDSLRTSQAVVRTGAAAFAGLGIAGGTHRLLVEEAMEREREQERERALFASGGLVEHKTFGGVKLIVNEYLRPDEWYVHNTDGTIYVSKELHAKTIKDIDEGNFEPLPWMATPPSHDE